MMGSLEMANKITQLLGITNEEDLITAPYPDTARLVIASAGGGKTSSMALPSYLVTVEDESRLLAPKDNLTGDKGCKHDK